VSFALTPLYQAKGRARVFIFIPISNRNLDIWISIGQGEDCACHRRWRTQGKGGGGCNQRLSKGGGCNQRLSISYINCHISAYLCRGRYVAPKLKRKDRASWKAAGVIPYTFDSSGRMMVLLAFSPDKLKWRQFTARDNDRDGLTILGRCLPFLAFQLYA